MDLKYRSRCSALNKSKKKNNNKFNILLESITHKSNYLNKF